jgi:hypothetical protein
MSKNDLEKYFEIYDNHFSKFRNKEIVILEIGFYQRVSLQIWKVFFSPKARIYFIDAYSKCKQFEAQNIKNFICSQLYSFFLKTVKEKILKIDISIDDCGNFMKQQIANFGELFGYLNATGIHTSYWWNYNRGYKRKNSFIEYSKNWADYLNSDHSQSKRLKVLDFIKTVNSNHNYNNIVVLEKAKTEKPIVTKTLIPSFLVEKDNHKGLNFLNNIFNFETNKFCFGLNFPFYIEKYS